MDSALRDELLAMAEEDDRVREELAADGSLYAGYHPRMEAVHSRNAARLAQILDQHGWPGISLVRADGEEAAWRIAQHAIAHPALQRRVLELLKASPPHDLPRSQIAYLEDRIRTLEGRPQLYGTQFDWDDHGEMSPMPIEDPARVDERRAAMGLDPLAERTRKMRAQTGNEPRPADLVARRREMEAWARKVGWRS
jgi:hypothetical protein